MVLIETALTTAKITGTTTILVTLDGSHCFVGVGVVTTAAAEGTGMALMFTAVGTTTGTVTAKVTMLGGSHRRAGAFGRGVVEMPLIDLPDAANLLMKATGASATVADIGGARMVIARRFLVRVGLGHGLLHHCDQCYTLAIVHPTVCATRRQKISEPVDIAAPQFSQADLCTAAGITMPTANNWI